MQGPEGCVPVVSNYCSVSTRCSSSLDHFAVVLNPRVWADVGKCWKVLGFEPSLKKMGYDNKEDTFIHTNKQKKSNLVFIWLCCQCAKSPLAFVCADITSAARTFHTTHENRHGLIETWHYPLKVWWAQRYQMVKLTCPGRMSHILEKTNNSACDCT